MRFQLDPRLETSSHHLAMIDDIEIRLANDRRFLWLLLVPHVAGATELDDLSSDTRARLFQLATDVSASLKSYSHADKMNVAAIGNIVAQFHFHIVARHIGDDAWPNPIWGHGITQPYMADEAAQKRSDLRQIVGAHA